MKKKIIKRILEDRKILLVNLIRIDLIHKISVLLKITKILNGFLGSIIDFSFLVRLIDFFCNLKQFKVKVLQKKIQLKMQETLLD